jgi:hypothetical protein
MFCARLGLSLDEKHNSLPNDQVFIEQGSLFKGRGDQRLLPSMPADREERHTLATINHRVEREALTHPAAVSVLNLGEKVEIPAENDSQRFDPITTAAPLFSKREKILDGLMKVSTNFKLKKTGKQNQDWIRRCIERVTHAHQQENIEQTE